MEYLPMPAFASAANASNFFHGDASFSGTCSATHVSRTSDVVFDIPIGDAIAGEVAATSMHISKLSGAQVVLTAEPSGCALHLEGTAEAVDAARSLLMLAHCSASHPTTPGPASV
jgi:hypothetical protein